MDVGCIEMLTRRCIEMASKEKGEGEDVRGATWKGTSLERLRMHSPIKPALLLASLLSHIVTSSCDELASLTCRQAHRQDDIPEGEETECHSSYSRLGGWSGIYDEEKT